MHGPMVAQSGEGGHCHDRNALIVQYRPYVIKIAREINRALPRSIEFDDLVGWGELGLVDVASRFDPGRGVQFRSFAHHRIRGAILDGLRFESGSHRCRVYRASQSGVINHDGAHTHAGTLAADDSPERLAYLAELRVQLDAAIVTLSPLEQVLIEHHYIHGQSLRKIAGELHLSKSWLSRLHRRALEKLRAHLTDLRTPNVDLATEGATMFPQREQGRA